MWCVFVFSFFLEHLLQAGTGLLLQAYYSLSTLLTTSILQVCYRFATDLLHGGLSLKIHTQTHDNGGYF